jgi:hypothetical protein
MKNNESYQNPELEIPKNDEGSPPSDDAKVPAWLILTYVTLPIWGIITFYLYWNGSAGWLDRGYWKQLQEAANTTFFEKS